MAVPEVLLSGNHGEIARWRVRERLKRTTERRPDLLTAAELSDEERRELAVLGGKEPAKRSAKTGAGRTGPRRGDGS